jgi:hypothetical protein
LEGHYETWPLCTKVFRRWLARQFYNQHEKTPNSQAIQDALGVLEGKALFEGAEHQGSIYLDLANAAWEAVEITELGW